MEVRVGSNLSRWFLFGEHRKDPRIVCVNVAQCCRSLWRIESRGFPFLRLSASCVRKLYEDFCEWIRNRGQELDYMDLDNQLSEYLREKYFEGSPRSFAVSVVKAVKFEAGNRTGITWPCLGHGFCCHAFSTAEGTAIWRSKNSGLNCQRVESIHFWWCHIV